MTTLKCTAVTCVFNSDKLCSRGNIDVMGEDARYSDETNCGSFRERIENSAQNSMDSGCGCEEIQIYCKAHNCTYNDHCKCEAPGIQVDGHSAHNSKETCCDTFDCKE